MLNYFDIDPRLNIKQPADILSLPVTVWVNDFNEKSVKEFAASFSTAHQTGQPVIPVVIDSYGGIIHSLFAMMDIVKASKIPVATIVTGKAMSCGAVLFSCGQVRYIAPSGYCMIHEVLTGDFSKVTEFNATADHANNLNNVLMERMALNCGHKPSYFKEIIHEKGHADWHLDATECIKHNLANHIGIPQFVTRINVEYRFTLNDRTQI